LRKLSGLIEFRPGAQPQRYVGQDLGLLLVLLRDCLIQNSSQWREMSHNSGPPGGMDVEMRGREKKMSREPVPD